MILLGDCLQELKRIKPGTVDLIYLDPPFFTQRKHSLKTRDNSKQYSFSDKWDDVAQYSGFIRERLVECHRILKKTGSVFFHCDRAAVHYLRIELDRVFGSENFRSEIIWFYRRWANSKKGLLNSHQTIYFYSKSAAFKFNHVYEAYSPTTNIDQIFQKRIRDKHGKTRYKQGQNGQAELIESKKGVPLSDVWEIPYLNPKANERVGYPTQKPILLLDRVIELVTNKGDLVVDPFCGSGTTLVSAKLLERKYIGIDVSSDAVSLAQSRLDNPIKSESALMRKGEMSYRNQAPDVLEILKSIDAVPVQRNKGIDGFLRLNNMVKPIPVKVQREGETLELAESLLRKASRKSGFLTKVLIKTKDSHEDCLFSMPTESERRDLILVEDVAEFSQKKDMICAGDGVGVH
jgi:site-specific DNA-methyltransferase (adenine-specific)